MTCAQTFSCPWISLPYPEHIKLVLKNQFILKIHSESSFQTDLQLCPLDVKNRSVTSPQILISSLFRMYIHFSFLRCATVKVIAQFLWKLFWLNIANFKGELICFYFSCAVLYQNIFPWKLKDNSQNCVRGQLKNWKPCQDFLMRLEYCFKQDLAAEYRYSSCYKLW